MMDIGEEIYEPLIMSYHFHYDCRTYDFQSIDVGGACSAAG